ncbi:MAG: hypothetical protein V4510_11815 [bacterium]
MPTHVCAGLLALATLLALGAHGAAADDSGPSCGTSTNCINCDSTDSTDLANCSFYECAGPVYIAGGHFRIDGNGEMQDMAISGAGFC